MEQAPHWLNEAREPGLVSVIVPAFNRAGLLRATVDSVLRQDYRPLELIVADDGSTDDTLPMLGKVSPPEGVSLHVLAGEHAGASAARNRGARHSRGEFVMFLDSDDVLHEGALAALVDGIGDAGLVHGQWRDWFSDETPPRFGEVHARTPGADLLIELLRNRWLATCAVLFRRAALTAWDEDFSVEDDFAFMARMALQGTRAVSVPRLVADYRRHGGARQSAADLAEVSITRERVLRLIEDGLNETGWTPERRSALAWRWFFEARQCRARGDRERFRFMLDEARRVDPAFRPPRAWYRLVAGVAGYECAERVGAAARRLFR